MPHDSPAKTREPIAHPWAVVPTRSAVVALLIGLTSLAVGATTSPWLVPPYLVAMGWLLLAPTRRGHDRPPSASEVPPPKPVEALASSHEPEAEPAASPVEIAPKPKKTRSRAKSKAKAKDAAVVPATLATFVQVAPGKFVRVDVAVPIEAPADPESIAPAESEPEPVRGVEESSVAPESPQPILEPDSEPIHSPTIWGVESRSPSIIIEPEPSDDRGIDDPPAESRLVATGEPSRPAFARPAQGRSIRFRLRRDPRPKARRGNGRVGASPRVVLHRA